MNAGFQPSTVVHCLGWFHTMPPLELGVTWANDGRIRGSVADGEYVSPLRIGLV